MLVRTLSAVMHRGVVVPLGQSVEVDDDVAESLLERGLAELVETPAPPAPVAAEEAPSVAPGPPPPAPQPPQHGRRRRS